MLKIMIILGVIMSFVAIVCNILAVILEKKYKSKMTDISNDNNEQ